MTDGDRQHRRSLATFRQMMPNVSRHARHSSHCPGTCLGKGFGEIHRGPRYQDLDDLDDLDLFPSPGCEHRFAVLRTVGGSRVRHEILGYGSYGGRPCPDLIQRTLLPAIHGAWPRAAHSKVFVAFILKLPDGTLAHCFHLRFLFFL